MWKYCYCFHSMGGVGVEREGGDSGVLVTEARRMDVLYNVELVSCVLWCKDDSNE